MIEKHTIFTIGHSNRAPEELLELLREHAVAQVADVRRFPGSRRHPHFSGDRLDAFLAAARIVYRHFPALGGYRTARENSPHRAWDSPGFQGYADHMESEEFMGSKADLLEWSERGPTAVLCAEATPRQCHRQLLADALVVGGCTVRHILRKGELENHILAPFARVEEGRIIYDGGMLPW